MTRQPGSAAQQLLTYLQMLAHGHAPGQFFDVRWQNAAHAMRRRALPADGVRAAARTIRGLATHSDVFIGVALRDSNEHGGKRVITGSRFLFIECDHPDSLQRLPAFAYPPSMIVTSGTTGHLHLYWQLTTLAPTSVVESANRRLARLLGGDPACVDVARVLRPAGTLNYKHTPPAAVLLHSHHDRTYKLTDLTAGLPDDPQPAPSEQRRVVLRWVVRTEVERELRSITTVEYVRVLAGVLPNRDGKVLCPFHQENTPSLHLYPDGSFYCFGSGCGKGGSIFDFAGYLWHITPQGAGYLELRDRLAETFGLQVIPCA